MPSWPQVHTAVLHCRACSNVWGGVARMGISCQDTISAQAADITNGWARMDIMTRLQSLPRISKPPLLFSSAFIKENEIRWGFEILICSPCTLHTTDIAMYFDWAGHWAWSHLGSDLTLSWCLVSPLPMSVSWPGSGPWHRLLQRVWPVSGVRMSPLVTEFHVTKGQGHTEQWSHNQLICFKQSV